MGRAAESLSSGCHVAFWHLKIILWLLSEGSDTGQALGGQKIVVPALPVTCSVISTGHSTVLGLSPYQNVTDNKQYQCLITKGCERASRRDWALQITRDSSSQVDSSTHRPLSEVCSHCVRLTEGGRRRARGRGGDSPPTEPT